MEKLGGNDPCPCGSGRRFPPVLPPRRPFRRHQRPLLLPRLRSAATTAD
ncbi:SEC-C metal-binding domain-containing protein [Actinoplanes sp. NBC_00393]